MHLLLSMLSSSRGGRNHLSVNIMGDDRRLRKQHYDRHFPRHHKRSVAIIESDLRRLNRRMRISPSAFSLTGTAPRVKACGKCRTASGLRGLTPAAIPVLAALPPDAVAHCAGRRERPPRRSRSHGLRPSTFFRSPSAPVHIIGHAALQTASMFMLVCLSRPIRLVIRRRSHRITPVGAGDKPIKRPKRQQKATEPQQCLKIRGGDLLQH
jgi:hypothetical protein